MFETFLGMAALCGFLDGEENATVWMLKNFYWLTVCNKFSFVLCAEHFCKRNTWDTPL